MAGDRLAEVEKLVFSHPGIEATSKQTAPRPFSEEPVTFESVFDVRVADSVPPGRYEVRTLGRHGLSNPRAFLVSPFANTFVASVGHSKEAPTALPLGTVIQATATAAEHDWFQVRLESPTALSIELIAQRVDSRMIGQLKLIDPNGKTVASVRGADQHDPTLNTEELPAGDYLLLVHDFLFRGGSEFPYQLLATSPQEPVNLIARSADVVGQLPEVWNSNSSAGLDAAMNSATEVGSEVALAVPADQVWWFAEDQSDRVFRIDAKKGDAFALDVRSQRLGEPTDARLLVQRIEPQKDGDPKLVDVANADDSDNIGDAAVNLATSDPQLTWTVSQDATYRIVLRDLDRGKSLRTRKRFQLRANQLKPRFELVAYRVFPHKDVNQSHEFGSKLFRGGAEAIRVLALRRDGWTGPIRLNVTGLPAGVSASKVVLAANQNQTQITLTADETQPEANATRRSAQVQVVGESEDGALSAIASPVTLVWGRGGGREFIRSRQTTTLGVCVSDLDVAPVSIQLGDGSPLEVKKEETLSLPVKLTRREGGKAPCVVRPRDLPPGVTAADVTIPAENTDGTVELKVSGKAIAGTYSPWFQVETKIKVKPNPQKLTRTEAYRAHLQTLHDDPAQASQLDAIKAAIVEADKLVEAAKADAKEQELTVFIPSPNATISVVEP